MGNLVLPREEWTVGTGSVGSWSQSGATAENWRTYGVNPWGQKSILWNSACDGVLTGTEPYETPGEGESNADGGWVSPYVACDYTEKYRFTWWVKRQYGDGGRNYFGLYTYNSSFAFTNNLAHNSKSAATNHYFWVTGTPPTISDFPENEWVLVVAFCWPYGESGTSNDSDSGVYLLDGTKHRGISYDMDFGTTDTVYLRTRSYQYYSIQTLDSSPFTTYGDLNLLAATSWYWPRLELVDGTEPTITEIIRNANYQATMLAGNGLSLSVQCNELLHKG